MFKTAMAKKPAISGAELQTIEAVRTCSKRLSECHHILDAVVRQRDLYLFAHELYAYISQLGISKAKLKIVGTRIDEAEGKLTDLLSELAVAHQAVQTARVTSSTNTKGRVHGGNRRHR